MADRRLQRQRPVADARAVPGRTWPRGKIHYFIGGGGFGGAAERRRQHPASEIAAWVAAHFTAQTVDGVTVYDLTATSTATSGSASTT